MVQAIDSAGTAKTKTKAKEDEPNSGAAAAGLEAQLVRFQKELSECVNCASAKTPEGKAQIEAISEKIGVVKERIDKASGVKPADPADATDSTIPKPQQENKVGQNGAFDTVGSRLDVFA